MNVLIITVDGLERNGECIWMIRWFKCFIWGHAWILIMRKGYAFDDKLVFGCKNCKKIKVNRF